MKWLEGLSCSGEELSEELVILKTQGLDRNDDPFQEDCHQISQDYYSHTQQPTCGSGHAPENIASADD